MKLPINEELKCICKEILDENKTIKEWIEIESCDMFQTENFCGGFEGTDERFSFSYYDGKKEYWFEFLLSDAIEILNGNIKFIECKDANNKK